jgi:hypothetical protein
MVTLRIKPNIMDKTSRIVSVGYEYRYMTRLFSDVRGLELERSCRTEQRDTAGALGGRDVARRHYQNC